jgi:hypothetical protein
MMAADDHLSPSQFGFKEISHENWIAAQQTYNPATARSGRLNLGADLHTGQPGLFPDRVQEYVDKPGLASDTGRYSRVEVYHHEGQLVVGDGHHRIAAALKRGQKTIRADFHG